MTVLGIETSCDETAVAVVTADKRILAHKILSQVDTHAEFGGVVPEIAARQHISSLDHLIAATLKEAELTMADIDAVAATTGPGLVGGLMVGVMTAKALATASGKPFIAVNHLEGHALTARLTDDIAFPFLLLLTSGGHCQLLEVSGVGNYKRLGTTIDDAAGEAFDKTAKLLGLGYPGGPAVEREAAKGNPDRFKLPHPLKGKPGCDFSFSGLKTAVRRLAETCVSERGALYEDDRADLCAAFQQAVVRSLTDRVQRAVTDFRSRHGAKSYPLVIAGGVAANKAIRAALVKLATEEDMIFYAAPMELCTDNGAMIAWAGLERLLVTPTLNDMDVSARPRWPLDENASSRIGAGKKGAKA
ncbi:tRNA N6-adenosine threonylcarbamoyltransferase [Kordiimonas sediminis]|uniref:tRNA N6-adenosine threonylcarbamoyltransferase n=1 Tax=Kordiimonas sediminis TaxID=1735581 RepID=A0A919E2J5_9PROT|nr:tRNA N6-adenosine threonylcarbamoyltransferase [Kordiimonas sediminis]